MLQWCIDSDESFYITASVDKQAVRAEFDKIKVGFEGQVKAGKVSSDVAAFINTLFILFSIVLSIFLEKNQKNMGLCGFEWVTRKVKI